VSIRADLRRRAIALVTLGAMATNGCYRVRRVDTAPAPGTRVVLRLNDAGRVAYGDRIGPSIVDVEGTVAAVSDTGVALHILGTRDLSGRRSAWAGEPFQFSRTNYVDLRERSFSRSRTAALSVAIVASVITAALAVKLIGGGSPSPGDGRPPPPSDQ